MAADHDEFDVRLRDAKLAAMAELAAGAGHEINNPVATIVGRAQQLLATESDPNRRRALATIVSQAFRIRDMIGDLMLFARPPEPQPVVADLSEIVRDAVTPFADRASESGVTLSLDAPNPVTINADPLQLSVAMAALVENALNAVHRQGRIEIAVANAGGIPTVQIRDDGPGLSDEDRRHAFDPFYAGRQAGRGLGFGLPKAWRIVTLAGGDVRIDSRPGETTVTITLRGPSPSELPDADSVERLTSDRDDADRVVRSRPPSAG